MVKGTALLFKKDFIMTQLLITLQSQRYQKGETLKDLDLQSIEKGSEVNWIFRGTLTLSEKPSVIMNSIMVGLVESYEKDGFDVLKIEILKD